MNEEQVDGILGDLLVAHTAKIIGCVAMIVIGLILGGVGGFLIYTYKKIVQMETHSKKKLINVSDNPSSYDQLGS